MLIARPDSGLPVDGELKGLAEQLAAGRIKRFAIANPEHAPYGRRAEEALRRAGLWEAIRPRLVLGENVSQAAQFAVSGSADGGIIALSLAKAPQMERLGRFALIPAEWHAPLRQRMVLLKSAGATAEAFYRYMQEPPARAVMRRYGFVLPGRGLMDWTALKLSLELGAVTVLLLLPAALFAARLLAYRSFRGKPLVEALLAVPLVLPPTVVGYYLLVSLGGDSFLGQWVERLTGHTLVFSFSGLVVASVLVNIPFAVQPIQRAFEAIPHEVRDAAACCGMGFWRELLTVELPLAWPGVLTGLVLTFAHTLGEFGVVLMVGGSIPGETKTVAIAIYDRVQAFDFEAAGRMSLLLLVLSVSVLALASGFGRRVGRRHGEPRR